MRVVWDAIRRDPNYAVAVVRLAANTTQSRVEVACGGRELHIYDIDRATLREGLTEVIASGERRQVMVAEHATFLDDGSIELPPELWARWNEAETAIDYAATIRAALPPDGEDQPG